MSWDSLRRKVESEGDKIVWLVCTHCGGGPFPFKVAKRADPAVFMKYFHCPNCGETKLTLEGNEDDEKD